MLKKVLLTALFALIIFSGCQNALDNDASDTLKEEQYKAAVVSEINALIDDGTIEIMDSTSKSLGKNVSQEDYFTFTFTSEEESTIFQEKLVQLLQEIYGEDWEDQVQSERVDYPAENYKATSKGDYTYQGTMKYGNGWWYTVFVGHAWAYSQHITGAQCSYLYASLHYKYNGPWHTNDDITTTIKYNTTKASADVWTGGFPAADVVVVQGSAHSITYAGVPYIPKPLGNY